MMHAEQAATTMREAARRIRAWAEASKTLSPEMAKAYGAAMERQAWRLEMDAAALEGVAHGEQARRPA